MAFEAALKLDVTGFTSGVNKATEGVNKLSNTIQGLAVLTVAAEALGKAAQIIGDQFKQMYAAMEAGGALIDLSEQTGLAVDKLMVLKTAFSQAGMGADEVQPFINKMQKAIEAAATSGGPAADAFNKLGLSASYLSSLNADEQLKMIGEAMNAIPNRTQRSAAAMEIFGRSGGRMLALFGAGGLEQAGEAVGRQAQLMKQNAGIFDKVTDILGTASTKLQGLYVGVASNVAPMLVKVVEAFNKIDLSGVGQQIGAVIAIMLEAFAEGKLGKLVFESLRFAFIESVNILSKVLSATMASIIELFASGFRMLMTGDFWSGMLSALVGIAQSFIEVMANGVASILDQWAKLPMIGERAAAAAKGVREYARQVGSRGEGNTNQGVILLEPLLKQFAADIKTAAQEAYSNAPTMTQDKSMDDLVSGLITNASARIKKAREENPTPENPVGGDMLVASKKQLGFGDFTSSLTKIGGNQFGPSTMENDSINIQRQQLQAQQKLNEQTNQTNILLKELATKQSQGGTIYQ